MSVSLDTSGVVYAGTDPQQPGGHIEWEDLSPFCQGYVEAAFASLDRDFMGEPRLRAPELDAPGVTSYVNIGFSDLHPATLARFMEDCETVQRIFAGVEMTADDGRRVWRHRAEGFPGPLETDRLLRTALRPLRLHLSPDGKVLAEEVG